MAFDAGFLKHVCHELNTCLAGGRVDRISQPSRDEVVLYIRCQGEDRRLYISAGGNGPRLHLTEERPENPHVPPMFCMLLRKHFSGARFTEARMPGFERVAILAFETRDELGEISEKKIICEMIGRFANIILTDSSGTIIGQLKTVDFSTSEKRQVLAGLKYELPPAQDKRDPTDPGIGEREFNGIASGFPGDMKADKFIMAAFSGISPLVAREISYRAAGHEGAVLDDTAKGLWREFSSTVSKIRECGGRPWLVKDETGHPVEYSFTEISQYGPGSCTVCESFGELLDAYYGRRGLEDRIRKKSSDISRLIKNAEGRIERKIAAQKQELEDCEAGDRYKLWGDLITANIYRLKRGMESCELVNWDDPAGGTVEIPLDKRLTPQANAQIYYKKYSKAKVAKVVLARQIESAGAELEYMKTVADSLERAENESDLSDIRAELYQSGYASKMKNYTAKKNLKPQLKRYRTSDGHLVLCGRNNTSNDYLTTKYAAKTDWWFHVKNQPGSHVVLVNNEGETDPPEQAFTEAAEIAAHNSSARDGVMVPVDYITVSKVKKPSGSKPGFVIYTSNWTAYVTPDAEKIKNMSERTV